ncbi:hypothetical protein QCA50_006523 [Cerrena zonata]|uniref:Uncharacterized protein n=1 Tax=Cerrena zonata TaxID=2478898 RepID=A0AAW0GF10_9APHY
MELYPPSKARKLTPLDQAAERYNEDMANKASIWYGSHCETHKQTKSNLISHIKEKHGIDVPGNEDLFPDPDRPPPIDPVYVILDDYKDKMELLPHQVLIALNTGRAMFEGDL